MERQRCTATLLLILPTCCRVLHAFYDGDDTRISVGVHKIWYVHGNKVAVLWRLLTQISKVLLGALKVDIFLRLQLWTCTALRRVIIIEVCNRM